MVQWYEACVREALFSILVKGERMASFLDSMKAGLYSLFNMPYVSELIREMAPPLAVHISDTPRQSYPYIYRLVRLIEPTVLIHTGDLLDDIKLENRPSELKEYDRRLRSILPKMEALPVDDIYLVLGNHDDPETVIAHSSRSRILPEKSWIEAEGFCFFLSHRFYDIEVDADFYLFGHDLPEIIWRNKKTVILNGIPYINLISLSTGNTYTVAYPPGTDSIRQQLLPRTGL